ncbi:hypothetical protein FA13DRAFT_1809755 [Coprinellus micaceus]|uniref:F-box domain-containing protein n=1 Tax=Coprinellus micaceus TaxID=71717 RepID=A0A4Y7TSF9_COPMI|nr:hypothetical protein FA13DRAFT_1809755 [Coprinellus micaceus]
MQESTESKPASESPCPVLPDATQGLVDASSFVTDTNLHQQKVAKRIRELENEIRALKSCHNASTVTCRIPIEVLSKIFHFLTFSEPEPWLRGTENSNSYRWIQVTHVCRHWRSSAIDSTALWRHLNFEEPSKLVGTMLERSKGVPVDVVWRHHKIRHAGDLDTLLEILRLSQLTGCASVLEELEFEISQTFSTFSLPETLFSGGTPILSRLRVHGVKMGLNGLLFSPSLTTLRLRGKAHTPLTASSLLETFGQMRNLQTLQLDGFLDFSPGISRNLQSTGVPLFTFPSLLNMGVHGHPKDVNYFLQLTRCNTAVSVEVDLLVPQEPLVDDSPQAVSNILTWWGYSSPETKLNVRHFNLAADLLGLELDFDPETVEHLEASSPRGKNRLVISSPEFPRYVNLSIISKHTSIFKPLHPSVAAPYTSLIGAQKLGDFSPGFLL